MKNNSNMMQEEISALADGELCDPQLDAVLASLRDPETRKSWEVYHQIGDILRSDEMAVSLSPDFASRMAARLDAEPSILAPAICQKKGISGGPNAYSFKNKSIKRLAMPGMAAAAVAALAFVATPQLTTLMDGNSSAASVQASTPSAPVVELGASQSNASTLTAGPNEIVLRDPHIDAYLLAHQGFSPSLYSTAQFARSANFATDSDK